MTGTLRALVELQDFTENAPVAMHRVGPDGTILWANRAELDMLGYARDEYVGRSIIDFHVDPPVINDILCRLNERKTIRDYEARLRRKDGEVLHVQITSDVRWEGDPPRFVHTRCFTRDITERRRAEADLRRNEAWLEAQKEALQSALNGEPLEASLRVLVNGAVAYFGADTRTAFYLANAGGTALHHIVGMPAEYAALVDGFKISLESFSCGLAAKTRKPVLTADVEEEPLWRDWLPVAKRFDFRGCWSFPVHALGELLGTFAVYSRHPRRASERDVAFAAAVTDTAAIIISRHIEATARQEAQEELRAHTNELNLFNRAAVGRELRMIALKQEVNELCRQHGLAERYPLDFEERAGRDNGASASFSVLKNSASQQLEVYSQ